MPNELSKPQPEDTSRTVYVSTTEIVVPYRPFAEFENWLKYRFEEKDQRKTAFIWVVAIAFLAFGGPFAVMQLIVWLLTALKLSGGAAAATASVASMQAIVAYFYAFAGALGLGAAAIYYTRPTHLSLSDQGVRFIYDHELLGNQLYYRETETIPWSKVSRIHMLRPANKPNPQQHSVVMLAGSVPLCNLRLGAFLSTEDRAHVLEAVEKWAPQIARDAEVIQALEPPADHSYTELWMKALSAPPKREKLKPLVTGALLREGRYEVEGALGVGGQGTAYLAYDIADNRATVVLKEFILPVYVDIMVRKQALDKFEREAKILKQLDHDQVVKLVDFFVEDHRGYLVLEHIDGASLRQLVEKNGMMSEAKAKELASQMCTILEYLHNLTPPVVHRDFTPDNLILRKDGTLKLVDFNVAQQTESTATGTVVGKHAYLPPEQFRGLPTTQSDIYAMGATLYYILTAQDPEPISEAHPRTVRSEISEEFDTLIGRATAIDAKLRYQRAEEIAADLGAPAEKLNV
jgi:tRNA A-37 threonylcarbamoyl transferase component Bud32